MATFTLDGKVLGRVRREIAAPLVEAAAIIMADEVKLAMSSASPRTGRTYLVPGTSTEYIASAPGEPPAIREGLYIQSWQSTPATTEGTAVRAFAFTDLKDEDGESRGRKLEYGTERIKPRPHVRPAKIVAAGRIRELVRQAAG